jgi:hypothetical protein
MFSKPEGPYRRRDGYYNEKGFTEIGGKILEYI